MLCSCRTAPLRIFVRSLSQLHISEAAVGGAGRRPAAHQFRATRPREPTQPTPSRWRAFHGTATAKEAVSNDSLHAVQSDAFGTQQKTEPARGARRFRHVTTASNPIMTSRNRTAKDKDAVRKWAKSSASTSDGPAATKRPTDGKAKKDDPEEDDWAPPEREPWQTQKAALKAKFPDGWRPRKKLSPDALAGMRALHAQFPEEYTTGVLAAKFEVSPEAVRRILRSKWMPSPEEEVGRQDRWFRRGMKVWERYAELGMKPPRRWRAEGVTRDVEFHERRQARIAARKAEEELERSPRVKLASNLM